MSEEKKGLPTWFTNEIKFLIQIGVLLATITFAWSALDKQLALQGQDILLMKENHLSHMETDIREVKQDVSAIQEDVQALTEAIIRLEQLIKQ